MRDTSSPPFSTFALRVTACHVVTYFIAGVFALAALGGLTLFLGFHLRQKPLPVWMILGHGLVGIAGVVLLAITAFRQS